MIGCVESQLINYYRPQHRLCFSVNTVTDEPLHLARLNFAGTNTWTVHNL